VAIAYQVFGEGPVDLVFARGFAGDLLTTWEQPPLVRQLQSFAAIARVLMLDKRGTGLSDGFREPPTLETRMDDLRLVMDATGSERAVLWSAQDGARLALLFAATYPERTAGLVLYDPHATSRRDDDYPWAPSDEGDPSIDALVSLYRTGAISRAEFAVARAEWLDRERVRPQVPGRFGMSAGNRWIAAFAGAAVTPQDALDALAVLPSYLPLPPDRLRFVYDDEAIGMTFLMAGRVADALPFLRHAAGSCDAAQYPLQHTWANLELGRALESSDVGAACAAYKTVIDRWAVAQRSTGGHLARERWTALGCR